LPRASLRIALAVTLPLYSAASAMDAAAGAEAEHRAVLAAQLAEVNREIDVAIIELDRDRLRELEGRQRALIEALRELGEVPAGSEAPRPAP